MKKIFLLFGFAMFLAIGALHAQNATKSVVYLKNGTAINCDILEMRNDTITIKSSDGSVSSYSMNNVERIANVSALNDNKTEQKPQVSLCKIRRIGRDLSYVGGRDLDLNDIYNLLDRDLYKTYRSAYAQAGVGAAFITTAVIAAGLGVIWSVWGVNESIRLRGYCTCAFSCVCMPVGCVLRGIAKGRIGWVVNEHNNERCTANAFDFSPSLIGFNDINTGNQSYVLGATLNINL